MLLGVVGSAHPGGVYHVSLTCTFLKGALERGRSIAHAALHALGVLPVSGVSRFAGVGEGGHHSHPVRREGPARRQVTVICRGGTT